MKILSVTKELNAPNYLNHSKNNLHLNNVKKENEGNQDCISANYDSIKSLLYHPNISFKGSSPELGEKTKKLLEEVEVLKKELNVLESAKESDEITKARKELEFCEYFENNRYRLEFEADKAKERAFTDIYWEQGFWDTLLSRDAKKAGKRAYNNSEYVKSKDKYSNYIGRKYINSVIVKNADLSDIQKKQRISELKNLIETKNKMIDYTMVPEIIDEYMNGDFGINTHLAGYDDVKDEINKLIKSLVNNSKNIPNCVVLYGAIGTGKTTFLKCVQDSAKNNVFVERFEMPNSNEKFKDVFAKYQEAAQKRYKKEGKRTILLMDDAEAYFAKSLQAALSHPEDYNNDEIEKLNQINKLGTNEYAGDFKSILDVLSQKPALGDPYKSAMTLFITTNYPHLMHDDLIFREGKMNMYHVGPADEYNLAEIAKFYFKICDNKLNYIKMLQDKPEDVQIQSLNHINFLDEKSKTNIMDLFKKGTVDEVLHIDTENVDFGKMVKLFTPNNRQGAYTNVQIKNIAERALQRYLKDLSQEYKQVFLDEWLHTKRALSPERYQHFKAIEKKVNLMKSRLEKGEEVYLEIEKLVLSKMSGSILSEKDENNLNEFLKAKRPRLAALQDKYDNNCLESEDEALEYEHLSRIFGIIDEKNEDFDEE